MEVSDLPSVLGGYREEEENMEREMGVGRRGRGEGEIEGEAGKDGEGERDGQVGGREREGGKAGEERDIVEERETGKREQSESGGEREGEQRDRERGEWEAQLDAQQTYLGSERHRHHAVDPAPSRLDLRARRASLLALGHCTAFSEPGPKPDPGNAETLSEPELDWGAMGSRLEPAPGRLKQERGWEGENRGGLVERKGEEETEREGGGREKGKGEEGEGRDRGREIEKAGEEEREREGRGGGEGRWQVQRQRERLGGSVEGEEEERERRRRRRSRRRGGSEGARERERGKGRGTWSGGSWLRYRVLAKREESGERERGKEGGGERGGTVRTDLLSRMLLHSSTSSTSSSFNCSSAESDEVFTEEEEERGEGETSQRKTMRKYRSWKTFLAMMQWSLRRQSSWVQLAGHQGNVRPSEGGEVLKRFSTAEGSCLQALMGDALRPFVPQFHGVTTRGGERYLRLDDLLSGLDCPVIMDCKMGIRTYQEEELAKARQRSSLRSDMYQKMVKVDPAAPTSEEHGQCAVTKPRYMQWRESISSTATLGFRIEGITMESGCVLRDFKMTRTREQVIEALLTFTRSNPHILEAYLSRLSDLHAALQESEFFQTHEVIGSSLLFVHDRGGVASVWMIDFGKTAPVPPGLQLRHDVPWAEGNREDGYLIGLGNLTTLMGSALKQAQNLGRIVLEEGEQDKEIPAQTVPAKESTEPEPGLDPSLVCGGPLGPAGRQGVLGSTLECGSADDTSSDAAQTGLGAADVQGMDRTRPCLDPLAPSSPTQPELFSVGAVPCHSAAAPEPQSRIDAHTHLAPTDSSSL